MTNQEPGTPEPPTSEELRQAARNVLALMTGRAPDPATERAMVRLAAALSHPESDTRELDVAVLQRAIRAATVHVSTSDLDPGHFYLTADHVERVAAEYARLSASPDLSIDREGLTDPLRVMGAVAHESNRDHEPHDGCIVCGAARPILAAIRGTTQPEPTDEGGAT